MIRIVCPPARKQGGLTVYPSHADVRVFVVADDGTETEVTRDIVYVHWSVAAGREPRVVLTFNDVSVDVAAEES